MFDHIKIEGFRSFKQVELDLSPLSVLIGPNNGGKSNFLDLISLMAEAGQGRLGKGIDSRGGYSNVAFGPHWFGEILIEFRFKELSYISYILEPPPRILAKDKPDVRYEVALTSPFDPFATSRVRVEEVTAEFTSQSPRQVMKRDANGCVFRWIHWDGGEGGEDSKDLESESELAIFQVKDLKKYPIPYNLLKQLQEWTLYRDINVGPESPCPPAGAAPSNPSPLRGWR